MNGAPGIYVGDMGIGDWTAPHPPRQHIFLSRPGGWVHRVFHEGQGVHEAQIMKVHGRPAVIGTPYQALTDGVPRTPCVDQLVLWDGFRHG